ncbi:MAG: adenosine kinase [Candidatus Puniceispirillales bacterium]
MSERTTHHASIVTVGNAIVDVIAHATDQFITDQGMMKNAMNLIDADRANTLYNSIGPATEISGGSAANTAVGIALLGGHASFIGKVGQDLLARIFRHDIQAVGVNAVLADQADLQTACSYILVTPDKNRTMNTYLGASIALAPDDINAEAIAAADIVYIEGYLYDAPKGPACWDKIADVAHEAGTRIAISLSDGWCVDRHRTAMHQFVKDHCDMVLCNTEEAKLMFNTDKDDAIRQMRQLVAEAAITDSEKGSIAFAGADMATITPDPNTPVLDTTGAGDLYASGYLYARHNGADLDTAIKLATITAGEAISHIGARPQTDLIQLAHPAMPKDFLDNWVE